MCLYPRLLLNRKYIPNKKNNFNPPTLQDIRLKYVAVGCGNCMECRKQKARMWQTRMQEELQNNKYKYFVTLTFSEEALTNICNEIHITESNAVAAKAMRRFLERWRKEHHKSLRHWFITELGHQGTERIHLHGIIFSNDEITNEKLTRIWQYGRTDTGLYCNARSINYIIKYVTKLDNDHKGYIPQIFCSAGIGRKYLQKDIAKKHKYTPNNTIETYTLPNGAKTNLCIYYRNHLYTEAEREKLWIEKIEKHEIYINGIRIRNIDTEKGLQEYNAVLEEQRKLNKFLGYGDDSKEWQKKEYNARLKAVNANQRFQKLRKYTTKLKFTYHKFGYYKTFPYLCIVKQFRGGGTP